MTTHPAPSAEPQVLFFQASPYGNLVAIVQHNGETVYFFLNEPPSESRPAVFGTRACWVRNLIEGPLVFNATSLESGNPPVFPRTHTRQREGQAIPEAESLSVIWFEEGNGAALIETDPVSNESSILAVIPPWSGEQGFMGYASECVVENQFCSPLPPGGALQERLARAETFWHSFANQPTPFGLLQPAQLECYRTAIGAGQPETESNYFNINGEDFPPRGLVEFRHANQLVLMTCGMSLVPQPNIELTSPESYLRRRVELGFTGNLSSLSETQIERARQAISGLASLPWRQFTWFESGHSCAFVDVVENCQSAVLVQESVRRSMATETPEAVAAIDLPPFRDDPVNLLWIVPVTDEQMKRLESKQATAVELATEQWQP